MPKYVPTPLLSAYILALYIAGGFMIFALSHCGR